MIQVQPLSKQNYLFKTQPKTRNRKKNKQNTPGQNAHRFPDFCGPKVQEPKHEFAFHFPKRKSHAHHSMPSKLAGFLFQALSFAPLV
jgi:hypothetical protein